MSVMPDNTAVWVDEVRCKACDICVSVCPAGVLSMEQDATSTLGAMVKVIHGDSCIGCNACELHCPDFAIYVAEKDNYKFVKLSDEAKKRQEATEANGFRMPSEYK